MVGVWYKWEIDLAAVRKGHGTELGVYVGTILGLTLGLEVGTQEGIGVSITDGGLGGDAEGANDGIGLRTRLGAYDGTVVGAAL